MQNPSILSLFPPLIAILLAILTRQVIISLLAGIWLGRLILASGNPLAAALHTIESLVQVFQNSGNTRTILFCALMGALMLLMQRSGGIRGFVEFIQVRLNASNRGGDSRIRTRLQSMAFLTGTALFIETSISSLTVGTLFRPLFDQYRISREKLAYIADSSSAPMCALLPLNAWGAYIMGLLLGQGIENPLSVLVRALPFNFYSMLALFTVVITITFRRDWGDMRLAQKRVRETGQFLNQKSRPTVSTQITDSNADSEVPARKLNMIIPLAVLVFSMPLMLIMTGWSANDPSLSGFGRLWKAMGQGSGSAAVLYAVVSAISVGTVLSLFQRSMTLTKIHDTVLEGMAGLLPLTLLMVLAFAIGALTQDLGTGAYLARVTSAWLSKELLPAATFVTAGLIAFSTGTSWGTYAIMIPIAVPVAQTFGCDLATVTAAVIGGGVFGDHCSPISDTTLISSMAAATDHIDHVRTQLPYALISGLAAVLLYLGLGILTQQP
ncbi:MAG TPA: sodium:solute symporter [bacterium]|nr:sodium:solute symporter [bacterium]